jgi:hypothetical protein
MLILNKYYDDSYICICFVLHWLIYNYKFYQNNYKSIIYEDRNLWKMCSKHC